VFIDDAIEIDVVVPVDTTVTRVPVKMKVPIKQKLHVKDSLKLKLKGVRVPLKMLVPVRMRMPLDQSFRVRGTITAPIDQVVRVPLRKTIAPAMSEDVQVAVQLSGKLPARIKATFDSSVHIDDTITTRLEPLRISARDVTLHVAEGR
jgi:hypothetical protein